MYKSRHAQQSLYNYDKFFSFLILSWQAYLEISSACFQMAHFDERQFGNFFG
jgi:hypothetical protein